MEKPRLLLIDDDYHVGRAFLKVAQNCGFEARMTHESAAFKKACLYFKPRVIICDLAMPGIDGIELLRYLADSGCDAKLLIISGLDRRVLDATGRLAAARGLNIAGTLTKPVRAAELRSALNRLKDEAVSNG